MTLIFESEEELPLNVTFDSNHVISIRGGGKKSVDRSNWPFVALLEFSPRWISLG